MLGKHYDSEDDSDEDPPAPQQGSDERAEEEAAAAKIQARFRGKQARKEVMTRGEWSLRVPQKLRASRD